MTGWIRLNAGKQFWRRQEEQAVFKQGEGSLCKQYRKHGMDIDVFIGLCICLNFQKWLMI